MTTSISRTYGEFASGHVNEADNFIHSLYGFVTSLANKAATWEARARQRRRLMALDDRMLRDIGINRSEAAEEYAKPFWKK